VSLWLHLCASVSLSDGSFCLLCCMCLCGHIYALVNPVVMGHSYYCVLCCIKYVAHAPRSFYIPWLPEPMKLLSFIILFPKLPTQYCRHYCKARAELNLLHQKNKKFGSLMLVMSCQKTCLTFDKMVARAGRNLLKCALLVGV
jgi:hypothetical protein